MPHIETHDSLIIAGRSEEDSAGLRLSVTTCQASCGRTQMSSGDPDVRHFFPALAVRTLAVPQWLALMPSKRERVFISFK